MILLDPSEAGKLDGDLRVAINEPAVGLHYKYSSGLFKALFGRGDDIVLQIVLQSLPFKHAKPVVETLWTVIDKISLFLGSFSEKNLPETKGFQFFAIRVD